LFGMFGCVPSELKQSPQKRSSARLPPTLIHLYSGKLSCERARSISMQYHSFYEPYQLSHGEWTSLHLTWLRTPIARSSKYSPWRLLCSHHIHDGGLRAQHRAYGEYRLSQQTHHIRELASHNFVCNTPPCSCKAKGLDPREYCEELYGKDDMPQWGDLGRTSTLRRRDRK
jgi:hypothetical protein